MIAYPHMTYEHGCFFDQEGNIVDMEADETLEDFYDGFEYMMPSSTGNPEDDQLETLSGKKYIEMKYRGSYEDAFNDVPRPQLD